MESLNIYTGKKILVTGHTGFKGAWLTIWLKLLGAEVIGYARNPTFENGIFNSSRISNQITDYRGDINDLENLKKIFSKEKPEMVFHLAAQPLVSEGYNNPVETFSTNIMGTVNVLEAIRTVASVKAAVMITTDKCYENKEQIWGYRENEPMGGFDPYSASKGSAEIVISAYRRSFFSKKNNCKIASARAGNVIGGGDWSENRLIPDVVKAVLNNRVIELRNPKAIRPWQHVLEPLMGYLQLGAQLYNQQEGFDDGWNFGPLSHEIYSVEQVIEKFTKFLQKGSWKDISTPNQPHEANILMLDITKAILKLNWKPIFTVDEALKFTADWYMNYDKTEVLTFSQEQIKLYEQKWKSKNEN